VAGAAVENHWLVLPESLPGFHAWLPPSEIKETSVINHMTLLPISENATFVYTMHTFHSIISFQNIKIKIREIKHETYITTGMLRVPLITQP
jgi:hypothetical protein